MGTMKTVETIVNPRERAGEKSPGKIYTDKLKVRRRREWRGVKDTFYDYTRWLYLMSVLGRFIMVPRNIKGFLRYRWMMSYLFVPHGMDKFTVGLRDEALRISHTAMNYVIADVTQAIHNCFRGDRRVGNDVKYSNECVLTDENSMVTFMMGFDKKEVHTILREVPTMFASNIFHQFNVMHYLDVAQQNGIAGDVCPMPEAEAGVSMDDDFCVLGCCAVQNNTTCDGSLMGNGIIAKRLERQYGIPTFQLATPLRHQSPDVMDYAVEQIKQAIAFVEEHTGAKWNWDIYFDCAKRVNYATQCRNAQLEINSTPYPQFFGSVFSHYNDTNYMGNSGRDPKFAKIDKKLLELAEKGCREKRMYAKEYRHRCIVWGVQPQYVIDMLYWMIQCWGVVPLADMLSIINRDMIADTDTTENREQAYRDMAMLNMQMIMRNHTHGGYKVLLNDLWDLTEKMNADMVMMWEHMSCKALTGLHGMFEEQGRELGLHIMWVCHDLCDPRVYTRNAIRDQVSAYMRTVMREEPLDPSLEHLPDDEAY